VEQWAELRREHFVRGVSIKQLAGRTGLSRNTVRAALRAPQPPKYQQVPAGSKLDPFKDEIHRLLKDDSAIPGQRIRELIAPLGFVGGKTPASAESSRRGGAGASGRVGVKLARRLSMGHRLATASYLVERDHERARFVGQGREAESLVEGCCGGRHRVNDHGPNGNVLPGGQHPRDGVFQQQRPDALTLDVAVDREAGDQGYRDREMLGHPASDGRTGRLMV